MSFPEPNAAEEQNAILKDTAVFSIGSYASQFLGVINSIALRRFLGPESMGVFVLLRVLLGYCGYASLGTTKAAFREIPFFRGKGNLEEAEAIKNQVFTFSIANSILPALGIMGYVLWKHAGMSSYVTWGLVAISLVVILQRLNDYYLTLLRAGKQFVLVSKATIITAAVDLLVTFTLVIKWQLYGLYAGLILSVLINLTFIHWRARYCFKPTWDMKRMKRLLTLGIPLLLLAFSYEILRSIDKIIIGK